MLTDEETQQLIMALANGQEEFSEADAQKLLDWAIETRLNQGFLENVLSGNAAVKIVDGELLFKITDPGIAKAEALIKEKS